MKLLIDSQERTLTCEGEAGRRVISLDTKEAFELISEQWVTVGWGQKYSYGFTWLGRPIVQLPEDMVRIQEVIYQLKPDVIIETGIAHGGSVIFYASLCKAMGKGRVIGIDVEIRSHNRKAIEDHELAGYITLIEGSSTDPQIVEKVRALLGPEEKVMVLLDSCHTKEHVLAELNAYSSLVTPGSYIVSTDGIMENVAGAPGTQPDWTWNNPRQASLEFVASNPGFVIEEPEFPFNESELKNRITYWPSGFIKRVV